MSNGADINNIFAEAAEKLRREAYAAGWRDAIATISKVASEIGEPTAIPDTNSTEFAPVMTGSGPAPGNGPAQGSNPWYVLQAVRKRPGMTGLEVISAVREGGHRVPNASIRTALSRLANKKLIVSRHKKWFPA